MPLTQLDKSWYQEKIEEVDQAGQIASVDHDGELIKYSNELKSDESPIRTQTSEEFVHALAICMLCSPLYGYHIENLYHEQYFAHGSKGSLSDEVDLMIYDEDGLSYALWEFKTYDKFESSEEDAIKFQLFGTATLASSPKLLVYATIKPTGSVPKIILKCIDFVRYKSYESWVDAGKPATDIFPCEYQDINYQPFISGESKDLKTDCTQADFRSVAASFHNEFFGEHPDNSLFINLVKCLLAKIYDERTTKSGSSYKFQIFYRNGKPESAEKVFENINALYREAYIRYIDQNAAIADEIDPKEFSKEKVKAVVSALEAMSITKGAALHGDIIGAFFEEILRVGFKQDKGMYFTHSNIVRFMIEAIGIESLTQEVWKKSTHPENRLPYIIDPACGSGTFLLHAMQAVTRAIKSNKMDLVNDFESIQFYNARMSDDVPNYWAENFVYGFDPKFIMAITAKVNMVLHGDGSAHIFKYDAFRSFGAYLDPKLRPVGEKTRSISLKNYSFDVCETFDVVLSNPPFGVTLPPETIRELDKTFSLSSAQPSEGLFIERCFQLLKSGGRLGLVLPESIFNAVDLLPVRILLYRLFNIKAIVALPRNVFIDTPTLTSLLFAQKKSKKELAAWDKEWSKHQGFALEQVKRTKSLLSAKGSAQFETAAELRDAVIKELSLVINKNDWISKRGKNAEIIPVTMAETEVDVETVRQYYIELLKSASINKLITQYIFAQTSATLDYEFSTYIVDEIGYKLSKRKEKSKPNQLCTFRGSDSDAAINNLHLCDEPYKVIINANDPKTILDYIVKEVKWS